MGPAAHGTVFFIINSGVITSALIFKSIEGAEAEEAVEFIFRYPLVTGEELAISILNFFVVFTHYITAPVTVYLLYKDCGDFFQPVFYYEF